MEDRDAAGYAAQRSVSAAGRRTTAFSRPATNVRSNSDRKIRRDRTANGGAERRKKQRRRRAGALYYPEALAEKSSASSSSRKHPDAAQGDRLSTAFVEEILDEPFRKGRFRLRTGQYSVRGGIISTFFVFVQRAVPHHFSAMRSSIRPFDISTQLSTGKLAEVEIVPNLKDISNTSAAFVRHVRRTGRLLDRRRRIHAETIQRHPHQNARRPRNPSEIDRMVTSRKNF